MTRPALYWLVGVLLRPPQYWLLTKHRQLQCSNTAARWAPSEHSACTHRVYILWTVVISIFCSLVASKSAYLDSVLESIWTHTSGTWGYSCGLIQPNPESVYAKATSWHASMWPQHSLPDSHCSLNMLALNSNHSQFCIVYTCSCVYLFMCTQIDH